MSSFDKGLSKLSFVLIFIAMGLLIYMDNLKDRNIHLEVTMILLFAISFLLELIIDLKINSYSTALFTIFFIVIADVLKMVAFIVIIYLNYQNYENASEEILWKRNDYMKCSFLLISILELIKNHLKRRIYKEDEKGNKDESDVESCNKCEG